MIFNKNYHFIGIGGVSMSAIAEYVFKCGARVSGSDVCKNDYTEHLRKIGVKVSIGHKAKNVKLADVIIYNSAIKENNVELREAKRQSKEIVSRGDFLGEISKCFQKTISISGSHGKTTTTAMIAETFKYAGKNPTAMIGGTSVNLNSNFVMGDGDYLIVEACEYMNNFHKLVSDTGVVLNIDNDHLDFFKNRKQIKKSFKVFEKNCRQVLKLEKPLVVRNCKNGDVFECKNIKENGIYYSFDVVKNNKKLVNIKLSIPHRHNIVNALFAFAVASVYGIEVTVIKESLENFNGTKRRFEFVGKFNEADVVLDYAHHPAEIKQTITTARKLEKKVVVVFQPHTFSRTVKLFSDFVKVLKMADVLYVYKTYPAREKHNKFGSAKTLRNIIAKTKNCFYEKNFNALKRSLKKIVKPNDIVLIVGAGDIERFVPYICTK